MKVTIQPLKIKRNPENQVTTPDIIKERKMKNKYGAYDFDENGIFSEKIFGRFGRCMCGKRTKPGWCDECGGRVLNKRKIPDFYIEFSIDLPNMVIDESIFKTNPKLKGVKDAAIGIIEGKGFLYKGVYTPITELRDVKLTNYPEEDKILIGKDAIIALGVPASWYNENTHRIVSVPHTSYRRITENANGEVILGDLNKKYIDMLRINGDYDWAVLIGKFSKFIEINAKYRLIVEYKKLNNELIGLLAKNNNNTIKYELSGQYETGMIRAVLTNNFSLDEDIVVIGKYFISTLYPHLYKMFTDEDGNTDIKALNQYIEDNEYYALLNRQPTIGAKSILGIKPVFSELDTEKYVIQANPIIYDGLAADVDGDVLAVIALYTKEACLEAKKLLPSVNYVEGSDESIRNGIIDEFNYVQTTLTEGET